MIKVFFIAFALTATAIFSTGCSSKQNTWTEEVQIEHSHILKIQRTIRFRNYQPAGSGGGADVTESSLEFPTNANNDLPGKWSKPPFIPMILDKEENTKEWFIVATFYMCNTWYEMGRPNLPYAEFHFKNGQWVQQPLSEKNIGKVANLLIPNEGNANGTISIDKKIQLMSSPDISQRHKVIVSSWKTNC